MNDITNITYSNDSFILDNLNKHMCGCCNAPLTIPYIKYLCNNDVTHIFNYSCVYNKIILPHTYDSKQFHDCIQLGCKNSININTINNGSIKTNDLIYIVKQHFDDYIWLYESRCENKYWIYCYNNSKTIEKSYLLNENNKHSNINCEYYKNYLMSLYNISDNLLHNIYSYLNLCKNCLKKKIYTNVICLCKNYKKCNKNKCNSNCTLLNKISLQLSDKKILINISNNTQQLEYSPYVRKIKRVNKHELILDINNVQGISSLKRDIIEEV